MWKDYILRHRALEMLCSYDFGSRDCAVASALICHQCGPGSIRSHAICGLSFAPLRWLSGFTGFPPSTTTNTSKFQFDEGVSIGNHLLRCARRCYVLNGVFAFAFIPRPPKHISCSYKWLNNVLISSLLKVWASVLNYNFLSKCVFVVFVTLFVI